MLTHVSKEYGPQWLSTQWIRLLCTANLSTLCCPAATGQSMMAIVSSQRAGCCRVCELRLGGEVCDSLWGGKKRWEASRTHHCDVSEGKGQLTRLAQPVGLSGLCPCRYQWPWRTWPCTCPRRSGGVWTQLSRTKAGTRCQSVKVTRGETLPADH